MRQLIASIGFVVGLACIAVGQGWVSLPETIVTPAVDPAPFATDKLSVLVIRETNAPQSVVMQSLPFALQAAAPDRWRILDVDQTTEHESEWVKAAMAHKGEPLPWLVVANAETGYSGPLTDDPMSIVGRYAK